MRTGSGQIMEDKTIVEYRGDHVYACITGKDNYEISLNLWRRIIATCEEYECYNILGESRTEKMSTADSYDHYKIFRLAGVTLNHRIAWVPYGDEDQIEQIHFIETVLRSHGLVNGAVFPNIEEARRWLLGVE